MCAVVLIVLAMTPRGREIPWVALGVALAQESRRLYPEHWVMEPKINTLLLHSPTVKGIREGQPLDAIRRTWQSELDRFRERRSRHLLYP